MKPKDVRLTYQTACIGYYNDYKSKDATCEHYLNSICQFFISKEDKMPIQCPYKIIKKETK